MFNSRVLVFLRSGMRRHTLQLPASPIPSHPEQRGLPSIPDTLPQGTAEACAETRGKFFCLTHPYPLTLQKQWSVLNAA